MAMEWNLQSIMLLLKEQEMKLSSRNVIYDYRFKSPYAVTPKTLDSSSSNANGIHWEDGKFSYSQLATVIDEATLDYTHL
jgi:hypothetical protein